MNENGNVYDNSRYKIFKDLELGNVRTYVDEKGEVWFFMNNIARILDIKNPNLIISNLCNSGLSDSIGISDESRIQSVPYGPTRVMQIVKETIIKKSALLFLCGRLRKQKAIKLFRLVSEQIVPSLAKLNGSKMTEYKANGKLVKELIADNVKLKSELRVSYDYSKEQSDKYNELVENYNELIDENEELREKIEELESDGYSFDY